MEKRKIALFTFNGDEMCFLHAMLNALDMHESGIQVKMVIEGKSTALLKGFNDGTSQFSSMFRELLEKELVDCACKACCAKTGTIEDAEALGIELAGAMKGHPPVSRYLFAGYKVITF